MRILPTLCAAAVLGLAAVPGCPVSPDAGGAGQPVKVNESDPGQGGGADAASSAVATVSGVVGGVLDESALEGVEVSLDGKVLTTTSSRGKFEAGVPAGAEIAIRFEKEGFVPLFLPAQLDADEGVRQLAEVYLLPESLVTQLPGAEGASRSKEAMLLVELDHVEDGGGQAVKLSTGHGPSYLLGTDGGFVAGNSVPATGVDESLMVLFLDVEGTATQLAVSGPGGRCNPVGTEAIGDGTVAISPGGMTYVYVSCAPVEESPAGSGPPPGAGTPRPGDGAPAPGGPPPPGADDHPPGGATPPSP